MHFDAPTAFQILIFAAVFSACQALWGLFSAGRTRRAVNQRLVMAQRGLALGDLIVELRKQRGLTADGAGRFAWSWLADLIIRSGVPFEPRRWAIVVGGVALGAAAVTLFFSHNGLIAVPAGIGVGLLGPFMYLKFCASRRAKALSRQLPEALDVIVRSLEAGHPVPTAISLVGAEMADPIGSEFGMAADEIAYGAQLSQAVANMAARCRHADVDLFAATIRLQDRSGGNLTGLLKMNAHAVRERQKLRMKIQAASSEGRASAMILTSAPFCVLILLQVSNPHFYGDVIHEHAVHVGLTALGVWMFIGNLIMRRMIDMRI
ncbi:MAG TPA: type II secretion system F family protein [Caulobacteraceae bacterium]|jgi:tight adherence protein B|nr:type II secretion system F family protein [Caulobacteraceae bacterium]